MSEIFGYMQAEMSEKQLAAQNLTAKVAVGIEAKINYLENELSRSREELIRIRQELKDTKEESRESSSSAHRLACWSLGVAFVACLFTAASFILQAIAK